MIALLVSLVGCEEEPPPAKPPPVEVRVAAPAQIDALETDDVDVELIFVGVGKLYRGFFASDEAVSILQRRLSVCVSGTAQVRVFYDTPDRFGTLTFVSGGTLPRCSPQAGANGLDLTPLAPIGRALAEYRDKVAAAFDVRIASFRTGIRFERVGTLCELWTGGGYPPDGSQWSPCVNIDGDEVCMPGAADRGVVELTLDPAAFSALQGCLR